MHIIRDAEHIEVKLATTRESKTIGEKTVEISDYPTESSFL